MYDENFIADKRKESSHLIVFWLLCIGFSLFSVIGLVVSVGWLIDMVKWFL